MGGVFLSPLLLLFMVSSWVARQQWDGGSGTRIRTQEICVLPGETMALWALGLLMNSSLWGISGVQRPRWYYGGMDFPFGVTLATSPTMLGFPFSPQPLLYYWYWVIIGILGIITISAIVHFTKQFLRAQKVFWGSGLFIGEAERERRQKLITQPLENLLLYRVVFFLQAI